MPRLAVEPLPLHRGRTFVKHFDAPFKTSIAIPTEVWNIIKEDNSSTIMLTGDSMGYHEITVELQNNKHVFTNGWTAFVEVERIPRGDMAVFAWVREGTLSMCLYGPNGGDKPMANRPPHGHPLLEDFHQQPTDDPENGGDVYVPANILGMVFELGAGVVMGPEIMQTLANVWHYWDSSFALYVCIIVPTQVGPRSHFWFGSNFSQTLEYRKRVVMFSSTATMSVVREFWVFRFSVIEHHRRHDLVRKKRLSIKTLCARPKQKPGIVHYGYYVYSMMSNTGAYRRHPLR